MSGTAELDQTTLERYLPDGPTTSLRRIQTLYGAIAEAAEREGDASGEFDLYYTPGELDPFVADEDQDRYCVAVRVDLTGDEPELVGVETDRLRPDDVPNLGFSRYPWGIPPDHSITRRGAKAGSDTGTITSYCLDCLERWTNGTGKEPAVGRVADEHPDGWVIEALRQLGARDDTEAALRNRIERQFGADASPRVVATVKIRVEPDDLEHPPNNDPDSDGFYAPGQLHVLNAGMRARKEEKLAEKNTDEPSRGIAACMVTNREGDAFGTADDPLAFYTVQHAEKFDELKPRNAWRSHAISSEAALLIQSGGTLVEECRRTRRGFGVYTIPYFTDTTPESAERLYEAVEGLSDDEATMISVQRRIEDLSPSLADQLRFYVIGLRNDSGDINVLNEAPEVTLDPTRDVADEHVRVLNGETFGECGFYRPDDWDPIDNSTEPRTVVRSIVRGRYADGTLARTGTEDPQNDDSREWLTFALLTGDSVPVERLLAEYVDRLEQERENDPENRLSENHFKTQYVQLQALAAAGRLDAPERPELAKPLRSMTEDDNNGTGSSLSTLGDNSESLPPREDVVHDDEVSISAVRRYRLEQFVDDRPALSENDDRLGVFLAGVLVGQLGGYQGSPQGRDMNRTAIDQYPPEQMTPKRVRRFVPELVGNMNAYTDRGASLFPELEEAISERLTGAGAGRTAGDEYVVGEALSIDDFRFHYALGQLYGKRAQNRAYDLADRIADEYGVDPLQSSTDQQANVQQPEAPQ